MGDSPAYCNPPFSLYFAEKDGEGWLEKAVEQAERGVDVLMVISSDKYFFIRGLERQQIYREAKSKVRFELFSQSNDYSGGTHNWFKWGPNLVAGKDWGGSPFGC